MKLYFTIPIYLNIKTNNFGVTFNIPTATTVGIGVEDCRKLQLLARNREPRLQDVKNRNKDKNSAKWFKRCISSTHTIKYD